MRKLIFLIGGSCAAKTTTERYLRSRHSCKSLVSATTRLPRDGEIEGKDYYFLSNDEMDALNKANEIVITPEWRYAVPVDEFLRDDTEDLVYSVINIQPAMDIVEYVRTNNVQVDMVAVFMNVPRADRVNCMSLRGMSSEEIELRLSREETVSDFLKHVYSNNLVYYIYAQSLNPDTQSNIASHIYSTSSPTNPNDMSYKDMVKFLWDIIDDIDTYSDMAKSDDKLYRSLVQRRQVDRWRLPITINGDDLVIGNA